ncbi:SidA/IucD/PvdA family monooxygenase [Actinomadura rudentiformis]|uniref:SidA/IucD/PvdA family monooxygenase n=2 Tax=Actinomadura rudentiformis TaxID=359158 RepID=A0A6H9YLF5_9ACTN|nr:SidA/IucD/PvdA family monooxygenase [Actinomadura rudentiformis]
MSRCLTDRSVEHVVLERGTVAHAWRTERWDSLRLLTPNWMSRLPGHRYDGDDPDGYMSAAETAGFLESYGRSFAAPVRAHTTVTAVLPTPDGSLVETDQGPWRCRSVVLATGAAGAPHVPAVSAALPAAIRQITTLEYRNPDQLGAGGVLVVGASASGVQIADELRRAGRAVTIAAGEHIRLPRTYRGRDIHWWMDAIGQLDERYDQVDDLSRARRLPSLQLVGTIERRTLDLNALAAAGVQVTGRLVGVSRGRAQFSGSLANLVASADLKLHRLLDRIDEHVAAYGFKEEVGAPDRPEPTRIAPAPTEIELSRFSTVVWATGYRPRYPRLDASVFDRRGRIRHDGGVVEAPGMYVLGLPFLRRRKSSFIDGVGPDAHDLCAHLVRRLSRRQAA